MELHLAEFAASLSSCNFQPGRQAVLMYESNGSRTLAGRKEGPATKNR